MTDIEPRRQLRQWRVTLTEDRDGNVTHAHLAWRTFPCAAQKWDGSRWYTFASHEADQVTCLDALKVLLRTLGERDWYEARYPR